MKRRLMLIDFDVFRLADEFCEEEFLALFSVVSAQLEDLFLQVNASVAIEFHLLVWLERVYRIWERELLILLLRQILKTQSLRIYLECVLDCYGYDTKIK